MGKFIDLTGQKFGNFVVLERVENNKHKNAQWKCECQCENKTICIRVARELKNGNSNSCGCMTSKLIRDKKIKHGMAYTPIYHTWKKIKSRCLNKNNKDYKYYGGRGITVCDEWLNSFDMFYNDMGNQPDGMTIERIDNNKGYFKDNCEWADRKTQSRNRRNVKINIEIAEEIREKRKSGISVVKLSKEYDVKKDVIYRILEGRNYVNK